MKTNDEGYPILQRFVWPLGELGRQICKDEGWGMKKDEPKHDWVDQIVDWTRGVPSYSIRDECLWVVDQVGGDILGENILEQSLIDEKTCEFKVLARDYNGRIYEWVPEFGQSIG